MIDEILWDNKQKLRELFLKRAIAYGDFTLASGKKSIYYINSKKVLFHADAITALGNVLYGVTKDIEFDAIGGLEVGAIPMTAAYLISYCSAMEGFYGLGKEPVEGFFVRKKAKEHGSKDLIEGQVKAGDKVVIIDDVLTTGGSVLQAIAAVEVVGAKVVRVICICDRLQGAAEALDKYDYRPIFTVRDFGIYPVQHDNSNKY